MDNKIYLTMVIRSQAEIIELLEKENQKYKEVIDKARTKSIYLQEQYNYILDDLIFLLTEVE